MRLPVIDAHDHDGFRLILRQHFIKSGTDFPDQRNIVCRKHFILHQQVDISGVSDEPAVDHTLQIPFPACIIQIGDMQVIHQCGINRPHFVIDVFGRIKCGGQVFECIIQTIFLEPDDFNVFVFFRRIDDVAVASLALPAVKGFVNHLKQLIIIVRIQREGSHPRGPGDKQIIIRDLVHPAQDFKTSEQFPAEPLFVIINQIPQVHKQELIPAKASRDAIIGKKRLQCFRYTGEHLITGRVSVGVIDIFEVIQVDHTEGEGDTGFNQ